MSTRQPGPAVARRQLSRKLRAARREVNKTQAEITTVLDWSKSKLIRIEAGQASIAVSDLIALLDQYPNLAKQKDELTELARSTKSPTTVSKYSEVLTPQFSLWLEHEAYADRIRQYEPDIVPGVLQIDSYATSIVTSLIDPDDDREPARIVAARRERIASLINPQGPKIEFIIDEAVVRRAVGNEDGSSGYSVMRDQLEHLIKLNTIGRKMQAAPINPEVNPNISLQMVPFAKGAYRIMRGPVELLEFEGEEDEDMMYFENADNDVVIRDDPGVEKYTRTFDSLKKAIPGPDETNEYLARIASEMP